MYAFHPEPEPAQRAALEVALERLLREEDLRPDAYRSAWRRAALEEDVAGDEPDDFEL